MQLLGNAVRKCFGARLDAETGVSVPDIEALTVNGAYADTKQLRINVLFGQLWDVVCVCAAADGFHLG